MEQDPPLPAYVNGRRRARLSPRSKGLWQSRGGRAADPGRRCATPDDGEQEQKGEQSDAAAKMPIRVEKNEPDREEAEGVVPGIPPGRHPPALFPQAADTGTDDRGEPE